MKKLMIFDLDGTLMNTSEGVVASVIHTYQTEGIPLPQEDIASMFIGPPIQIGFQKALGVEFEEAQRLAKIFRDYYKGDALLLAEPYPDIFRLLDACRAAGIRTAVATYKRQDYARRLLTHFGFDRYMQTMLGADMEGKLTKADIIRACLTACGCAPEDAVMIGDSTNDATGAQEAGIDLIGVTYGFGFHSHADVFACENAIGAADSAMEVLSILRKDGNS